MIDKKSMAIKSNTTKKIQSLIKYF